jgi:DNA polymerase III epsilon subunit-like protein
VKFLVCDLETTNKEPLKAEIVTGHFLYLDQSLNVLDEYSFKCRPELWDKAAEEASEIHGISFHDCQSFPSPHEAYPALIDWLKSLNESYFVCHARRRLFGKFYSFDYTVLNLMMLDHGWHFEFGAMFPRKKIISTHSLASYLKAPTPYGLKALAETFKLPAFEHHDAKADCLTCYELLKRMLPQVNIPEFLEWENYKQWSENVTSDKSAKIKPKSSKRNNPINL